MRTFIQELKCISCRLDIVDGVPSTIEWTREGYQFLLLARRRVVKEQLLHCACISHCLLMLLPSGDVFVRGAMLELFVPEKRLDVLEELRPEKKRQVLT